MGRRSDPAWRDRTSLDLLTRRVLPTLPAAHDGPLLLVGQPSGLAPIDGREVCRWNRRADGSGPGRPLPNAGRVSVAAIRMPRSRAALGFATRASASALRPGGLLLVYGANDEGTGAVEREFAALGAEANTWAVGGRCRVVGGVVPEPPATPDMEALAESAVLDVPHAGERAWVSFPGVFAAGRVDAGTRLLLGTVGALPEGASALDYGAGTGVIGAALEALGAARTTLLEPDALAAEAARRNVPGAEVVEAAGWAALEGRRFDVVVSNPPYHRGKAETVEPVLEFVGGLAGHLVEGGWARFVVQRRLPVEAPLRERFESVQVVADEGPFRVWEVGAPADGDPATGGAG